MKKPIIVDLDYNKTVVLFNNRLLKMVTMVTMYNVPVECDGKVYVVHVMQTIAVQYEYGIVAMKATDFDIMLNKELKKVVAVQW